MKDTSFFMAIFIYLHFIYSWQSLIIYCNRFVFSKKRLAFVGLIFGSKSSFTISGAILFLTLNISVAGACTFLWCIETQLSFFSRSSSEDDLSPYVTLNVLSCKEFISLLRALLRNIHTKGQYPFWDIIHAFITVFLFSRHMYGATLANALSFFTEVVYVIFKREFWI